MEGVLTIESYHAMNESERKKVKKDQLENLLLNTSLRQEISDLRTSIENLRSDISNYREEQVETSKVVASLVVSKTLLEDQNKKLRQEVNDLQQYTHCNNIEVKAVFH